VVMRILLSRHDPARSALKEKLARSDSIEATLYFALHQAGGLYPLILPAPAANAMRSIAHAGSASTGLCPSSA